MCIRDSLGGEAALLGARDEVLHDAIVDVRLEQGHANLAHSGVDGAANRTQMAALIGSAHLAERHFPLKLIIDILTGAIARLGLSLIHI